MTRIVELLFVLFLVFVFPWWDRRETKYLKTTTDPRARGNGYRKTIAWQIIAVAILLVIRPVHSLFYAPDVVRAVIPDPGMIGMVIAISLLCGALIPVAMTRMKPELRAGQIERLGSIDFFLPRTSEERAWFGAMCVTVGVCEELIFRGFLVSWFLGTPFISGLTLHASVITAAVAAAVVFGIDHGYQGWAGVLATGVLALMFTFIFFATGSLLLAMIVHVLLDYRILWLLPREAER